MKWSELMQMRVSVGISDKGCWIWRCQGGGKQEDHRKDLCVQTVGVTDEDAVNRVR